MIKTQTVLDLVRHDAQELHRKISDNIARAEQATWDDVKAAQADASALGARMKTLAEGQTTAARAGISAVIERLEAAGKLAEDRAEATRADISRANAEMLESAHKAARTLSAAVAAARSAVAREIEPKKVDA